MRAIKLCGGLGNQMFQYAFGIYLSHIHKEEVYYYRLSDGSLKRNLDISRFNVSINEIPYQTIKSNFLFPGQSLSYRIERRLLQLLPFLNEKILIEPRNGIIKEFKTKTRIYDGYWQSYKYLDNIEEKIRKEYILKDNNLEDEGIIPDYNNTVSIHFRRGDYLFSKNSRIYATCDKKYYTNAIKYILERVDSPKFYIFSDDLLWVKNNMMDLPRINAIFIDSTKNKSDNCIDLLLMSKCKHNIIANSTFSWWSAWLNSNSNKIIVAPKQWYKSKTNIHTINLIPQAWIRL